MVRGLMNVSSVLIVSTLLLSFVASALGIGETAPDFHAQDQNGKNVALTALKGKYVLLYFYPKDDTPGCTKEACNLRDQFTKFQKNDIEIIGVSRQDEKSHQAFGKKYHLPFSLLADTDGALATKYGVGKMPLIGLLKRQSVLIGKDGKVIRIYSEVDPDQHQNEVLKDVESYEHK